MLKNLALTRTHIETRIYNMIKRLGFFTLTIIAVFFIFGSEVLGAGSCGLSYDQSARSLIYSASGLKPNYKYNIQILYPDSVTSIYSSNVNSSSSGIVSGSYLASSYGEYTF